MKIFQYQSSKIFNTITIAVLCFLCLLFKELTKINFHKLELPKNKPEFSTTGFSANLYGENGDLMYHVDAESGIEFPDSDQIHLNKIVMEAYSESTGVMAQKLTSNDGWLDHSKSIAFLGESVEIVNTNQDPSQAIHVYTKNIHIDGKLKTADSDAPIKAVQGKSVLTGNGVYVDYEKQLLKIKSNVKVVYVTDK